MDTNTILLIVGVVVAVIIIVVVVALLIRRKRIADQRRAGELREKSAEQALEVQRSDAAARESQADARQARAVSDVHAAEADQKAAEAEQKAAAAERLEADAQAREATAAQQRQEREALDLEANSLDPAGAAGHGEQDQPAGTTDRTADSTRHRDHGADGTARRSPGSPASPAGAAGPTSPAPDATRTSDPDRSRDAGDAMRANDTTGDREQAGEDRGPGSEDWDQGHDDWDQNESRRDQSRTDQGQDGLDQRQDRLDQGQDRPDQDRLGQDRAGQDQGRLDPTGTSTTTDRGADGRDDLGSAHRTTSGERHPDADQPREDGRGTEDDGGRHGSGPAARIKEALRPDGDRHDSPADHDSTADQDHDSTTSHDAAGDRDADRASTSRIDDALSRRDPSGTGQSVTPEQTAADDRWTSGAEAPTDPSMPVVDPTADRVEDPGTPQPRRAETDPDRPRSEG